MSLTVRRLSRVHKIVGLVVGAQLLFWTISGVFFTLFPIETIRGDPWRPTVEHGALEQMEFSVSASDVIAATEHPVEHLELKAFLDQPFWMVTTEAGRQMIDARTAEVRSPLARTEIDRLIERFGDRPNGLGELTVVYMISENPLREYGGPLPAWVVEYEPRKQRIYIDATSGEVHTVRTTRWRIFDVLWRFHIMDITGEDRFDSWWLKLFAFLGLTMVLSGLVLIIDRARKGRLLG
ncbi:MAG: PepSY domain-containing protein [Hyphomonadaceae bacterium]|nr:PepSY domain-containing protein [Hyphomonadaceae bacterium]